MKKLFTLIVMVGALLTAFSAFALTVTPETLAKCEANLKTATTPQAKAAAEVNIYFYNGKNADPITYAEMKQIIEGIYAKHGIPADSVYCREKIYQHAGTSFKRFSQEAWKELIAKKDSDFWVGWYVVSKCVNLEPLLIHINFYSFGLKESPQIIMQVICGEFFYIS